MDTTRPLTVEEWNAFADEMDAYIAASDRANATIPPPSTPRSAPPTNTASPQSPYASASASAMSPGYRRSRAVVDLPEYVRPPLNITITVEEIATFCPRWLAIPMLASRLQRNGITNKMIVYTQLKATGLLDDDSEWQMATNRVKQNFAQGGRLVFNCASWSKQIAISAGKEDDLTANHWQTRDEHATANGVSLSGGSPRPQRNEWVDVPIVQLFANVPTSEFPTGRGRGMMTACIEFVRNAPDNIKKSATTAHWDWLIQCVVQSGLSVNPVTLNATNLDEDFVGRFNASH
ncbi:hypothetical protein CKM354_000023900 [Cercospora kikuchii]|uniref:Uncharacterized protein n=1 Tax=Cercospora kikuchii TaxID=84275 RepID=A0A9P3C8K7_9PEZI|nr:uncharacterized protein CKM354_000023900 [Cercospora kikuchii]GIZ36772.1 hypothetical protein CKM354_000023900 [Cercospora kikuchii]